MMRGIARASGEERPAPSDCTSPHPACVYKYMHVQHRHQDPSSQFPLREFALHRSLRERERERRRDAAKPSPAKSVSCFLFGCGLIDLNLCLTHSTCNVLLLFFDSWVLMVWWVEWLLSCGHTSVWVSLSCRGVSFELSDRLSCGALIDS